MHEPFYDGSICTDSRQEKQQLEAVKALKDIEKHTRFLSN